MNKTKYMERLDKLTWGYFIEQKIKEITLALMFIIAFTFVPFFIGDAIGDNVSPFCNRIFWESSTATARYVASAECGIVPTWGEGLAYIIVSYLVLPVLYNLISKWLKSNWKKARKRAREELKGEAKNE